MTALLKLRDYQTKTIRAIHEQWDAGVMRPASVLPTGAGKTVVFAHLAEEFLAANPGKRVLILSHTDELTRQAADKVRMVAPHRSVGIVKATQNEVHAEIISASVQSLRSPRRREQIRNVGLIIVDECHHATAATYRTILEHYGALPNPEEDGDRAYLARLESGEDPELYPGMIQAVREALAPTRTAGFTATLVRGDKAKLSEIWEEVAIRISIAFMIRSGYLLDVRGKRVEVPDLDLRTVKTTGGDYAEGALGDALEEAFAPEIVAKAYLEHAADRKGIVFAPTVHSADAFRDAFLEAGISCETVHGALPRDERRAILARLKSGETQVVANCMVLTEGFDEPTVSCAVIARPTKSAGLYQQMVGRVLRPDLTLPVTDRGDALILDVVGVSRLHDLRSLVDLSTRDDLPEDVDEDLSLLALEDLILQEPEEEKAGASVEPETWYVGPAETREFDPLGRDSARTWGRTPEGTYYLKAGERGYIVLIDSAGGDPGSYDVAVCHQNVLPGQECAAYAITEHRGVPFDMAVAWGEEILENFGGYGSKTLSDKKAKWRKEPASGGQVAKARRVPGWGGAKIRTEREIPGDPLSPVVRYYFPDTGETVTKGAASEIIDGHAAATIIEPVVKHVKKCQTPKEG